MGVFANGLEISGKAVQAQTIAAFPDVCFTPPQTPATPPGVPIPYPSFGMAADTEKGTATVKIKGKTVNIKNKSDEKRTSGTEAGCAPKKGIITSKNTGKKYFHKWSNDVKFEGEPVIRFTDLATHNHASPSGNTPPWLELANFEVDGIGCDKILAKFKLHTHKDKKENCDSKKGYWSEHYVENQFFCQKGSRKNTLKKFRNYSVNTAPCICMHSKWKAGDDRGTHNVGQTKGTNHYNKSAYARDALKENPDITLGEFSEECMEGVIENHRHCKNEKEEKKEQIAACLEAVFFEYLLTVMNEARAENGEKPLSMKQVRAMTRT